MENNELKQPRTTVRDYLKVLFRRKRVFLAVFLAMTLTVFAGLKLKTPVYEAHVTMYIVAQKQIDSQYYRSSADARMVNIALTHSEIVKSNPVIERVVQRLKLDEVNGDYEKKFCSPLKALLIDLQSAKATRKLTLLSESERQNVRFRKAVEALKKKIRVEPVRETDLFVLTVSDFDPANAARVANAVSRSYCMFDLEQQLAELKQRYGDKHLSVLQLKDSIAQMDKELSGDKLSNIEAIGPASVKIIEQANVPIETTGKSKSALLIVTVILALVLGVIVAFVYEGFDTTVRSGQDLEAELKLPLLGYVPVRRARLARVYLLCAEAFYWIGWLVMALFFVRFQISGKGVDPANPIAQFIVSKSDIALGVSGMAYLAEPDGSDWRVLPAALILGVLFFLVIWAFRKLAAGSRGSHNVHAGDESRYGHAYVNLAEQLYTTLRNNSRKSVLFTSALSGEGTTTVIANLGRILAAKPGTKVLIIDANLRKPGLHRVFSLDNREGLADVLSGELKLDDVTAAAGDGSNGEALSIVTAGRNTQRSYALFDSERMAAVIKQAEEKFDFVLLDGASLQAFKDTVSISPSVDGVIVVVGEARSRKEVLAHVLSLLERKKARLIGGILNCRTFTVPRFLYERA